MERTGDALHFRWDRLEMGMMLLAGVVAVLGARSWAGSWNDGSRLAAVEAMVDHGTLAIDRSIYVRVPEGLTPYDPAMPSLNQAGTKDKLFIEGHYFSDKSMVLSVYLAGWYKLLQSFIGLEAAEKPGPFAYLMTLASAGLALVVCAFGMARLTRVVGADDRLRLLLTLSFTFGTAALPYSRHVQQHLPLLAVVMLIALTMVGQRDKWRAGLLGLLAGLAYSLDLGAGPALVLSVFVWLVFVSRSPALMMWYTVGLMPFVLLHHVMNFQIGGTFSPANANPAYLAWEGSPFSVDGATGGWKHSPLGLMGYGLELLFGTRGFVLHHLPLCLFPIALAAVIVRKSPYRAEVMALVGWSVLTWFLYSAGSNNRSGACYSIRWLVPCLGAGYFALAVLLTQEKNWQRLFVPLAMASGVLALLGWWQGPWSLRMVPGYWVLVAAGLLGCGAVHLFSRERVETREGELMSRRAA